MIKWEEIKQYFIQNRVEIFVTIILIPIAFYMIKKIFKFISTGLKEKELTKNPISNLIVFNSPSIGQKTPIPIVKLDYNNIDSLKLHLNILFVDDDTTFKVVKILKQSGWINTKLIKDIKSLSIDDLVKAHIIFTDIRGVGKMLGFQDEGLGLAAAIKEKYPHKMLVIYSSEQAGNRFHKGFRLADDMLAKDAEPYEFISTIEQLAKKIVLNGEY
jgi:hypothetical protein